MMRVAVLTLDMRSVALTQNLALETSLLSSTGSLRPIRQIGSLSTQSPAESTPLLQHRPAHRLTGCDRFGQIFVLNGLLSRGNRRMADKAVSTVRSWLSKLNIKAPWRMTGVASSPEFQTHLPKATEYRIVAPASQKLRPSIPAAETDRIYDIRYWIRDERRSGQVVGGTNKKHMVTYNVDLSENSPTSPDEPPPALGQPYKWKRKNVSLLDNDAGGYTT